MVAPSFTGYGLLYQYVINAAALSSMLLAADSLPRCPPGSDSTISIVPLSSFDGPVHLRGQHFYGTL